MDDATILNQTKSLLTDNSTDFNKRLKALCDLLYKHKQVYDWVGFYFAKQSEKTLHLGPFAGEPTEHKVIPFGKGICGQVAESDQTFLVEDVEAQDNYIACSLNVKSEIVVPIFVKGQNIGQIDIDSHTANAFSKADEILLENINKWIAEVIDKEDIEVLDWLE